MKDLGYWLKTSLAASLAIVCMNIRPVTAAEVPQTESQSNNSDRETQTFVANNENENPFEHLKPEDSILPLEDGGFLIGSGEVKIFSIDDLNTPIETINLDSNPNTVTKEKAYSLFS